MTTKTNRPFGTENPSKDPIVLEPLLTPNMEKTVLACALNDSDKFAPWMQDLPELIPSGLCGLVAASAAALSREGASVTPAAAFQGAWENTHEDKFREKLTALEKELAQINAPEEQEFVLKNIPSWLRDRSHNKALATYATALEDFEKEPSWRNRDKLENAKELALDALTIPPGSQMYNAEDACSLLEEDIPVTKPIVEDLLEVEDVALLGSSSKAYKSWFQLNLAVCVACGVSWYGMRTRRVKVCIVNFELKRRTMKDRLKILCEQLKLELEPGWLRVITLRGAPSRVLNSALQWLPGKLKGVELVILDPLYQTNLGKDENTAEQISLVMSGIGTLARQMGAAVIGSHHFAKGNQASKDMLDRFSGSGVFGRYLDLAITMTPHNASNRQNPVYAVEFKRRGGIEPEPFCVRWSYPLLEEAFEYDPDDLKKRGGNAKYYSDLFINPLPTALEEPMPYVSWKQEVRKAKFVPDRTFSAWRRKLIDERKVIHHGGEGYTRA